MSEVNGSSAAERTKELGDFCRDSEDVLGYVNERCVGANPGFIFSDAAGRLVFGGERYDPTVIMIVTPEAEGFHLTVVKAAKHDQPFLVAMEHHEAHEDVVGTFPTPIEAFNAGLKIVDDPYPEDESEPNGPRA